MFDDAQLPVWQNTLQNQHPKQIIAHALQQFSRISISFSGAEDVVLIHMACQLELAKNQSIQVFSLDTGRLHPETYQFINQVREQYPIQLKVIFPDADQVQNLVQEKGLFSFYQDGHHQCCNIRKVEPLKRHLSQLDAWITGQRRDQSPNTRNEVPVVQKDSAFSSAEKTLVKFNPLANWSTTQVWEYIRAFEIPYNKLHERGFVSIGCEPCTRAVLPNQHEREGRWWWEEATKKECGLHASNPIKS
jgi:phosphoadenosine phosphosulfate reductase